ncbi:unnamed protein product [Spirodela intermedia]|uniref:DNA repair metallo-beta-lactamase domain-containing protein n=2 Tax=Spirodela intermedia TaxID=51605 RepID=A0A7I8IQZ9_SPIIN|nr:unnamed protein product [Spirodela intermedia]CAA6660370.1 unnamed protein product [Spirodela intermedia]CAA7396714.1 unnamed protein product [Spirodela intermedia]
MPIEMPRGLPFSVDTWTPNSGRKRHHFLTHAHRDHLQGFAANSSYPIYATRITKLLTLRHLPQIEGGLFVEIGVGETTVVSDLEGDFSVTALDANHCPGAVMFLFEGEFGNILHTGDCRLSSDCLKKLPLKYMTMKGSETCLDYLFLDCTFGRCSITIPSKESAIRQVINCIWKHPHAPVVYLACDLLGQEEILIEVSKTFATKIYVDKAKCPECFLSLSLIAPEILSEDASSRFQVCEAFPRLCERARAKLAEARAKVLPEPLFIRPSTQWYARGEDQKSEPRGPRLSEAERDEFGVWHVGFSMHSSRPELEWSLQLLRPRWVISTTPPCRATELEYVKDHCSGAQLATDGPIWRLLGMGTEKPVPSPAAVSCCSISSSALVAAAAWGGGGSDVLQTSVEAVPLTLFGRARMGPSDRSSSGVEAFAAEQAVVSREDEAPLPSPSRVGSPSAYNASLRGLYRSMNVPVPRPLPSLVELLEDSKRARIGL